MNESMPPFRPNFKKSKRRADERDPSRLWVDESDWYIEIGENGRHEVVHDAANENDMLAFSSGPEILVQAPFLVFGEVKERSRVVKSAGIAWKLVFDEIVKDPSFRFHFVGKSQARKWRKFEEFIAGTYVVSGWDEVLLGPGSGDGGADVIASRAPKEGLGSLRILEDGKAYAAGNRVRHETVRAMGFVVVRDPGVSQGVITTTSDFQPGVYTDDLLSGLIPYRLELRNGDDFVARLRQIKRTYAQNLSMLAGIAT